MKNHYVYGQETCSTPLFDDLEEVVANMYRNTTRRVYEYAKHKEGFYAQTGRWCDVEVDQLIRGKDGFVIAGTEDGRRLSLEQFFRLQPDPVETPSLRCLWCDGHPVLQRAEAHIVGEPDSQMTLWQVVCEKCGGTGPRHADPAQAKNHYYREEG